jgi:hypothetical protein
MHFAFEHISPAAKSLSVEQVSMAPGAALAVVGSMVVLAALEVGAASSRTKEISDASFVGSAVGETDVDCRDEDEVGGLCNVVEAGGTLCDVVETMNLRGDAVDAVDAVVCCRRLVMIVEVDIIIKNRE